MNKTAIKNYAVWTRNKLIADIEYKAGLMGITENGIAAALPQSTNEVQFFDIGTKDYASIRGREINQRNALVSAIHAKEKDGDYKKAFHYVVEKVAYTWFNRLVAIRFMEVNDYLPSRVRVLSSENENKAEPDMVTRPFDTDMSFTQQEEDLILKLKDENRLDELFRWLFIKQCHKLHDVLPLLFSPETLSSNQNDYMELLLTISFTDKDGVLWHLVHDIREQDFRIRTPEDDERQRIEKIAEEDMPAGQVEIIGWMYQYYNTEPKEQVFADLKKNIKISKDKIPAATQLFTPDWIVRYMVENSLGRLWVEGHPNEEIKKSWKYYLEEAEQEPEVQNQLAEIRRGYAALRPEEIKVIDPCMGSGHILVYLFEVLMQIYESQGWTQREAAQSIVQNNLFGLDIDERAAQLAYFAVMMKARQYDRRFLDRNIEPHVYEVQESNGIDSNLIDLFANGNKKLKADVTTLISELQDAKEYGSILNVTLVDFPAIYARIEEIKQEGNIFALMTPDTLLPLIKRAEVMAQKYNTVVTNPPYMGSNGMGGKLTQYIREYYPDSKNDIFSVFIERGFHMLQKNGFESMITMESWMFLSSFETIRKDILETKSICTLIHMPYLGKGGTSLGINFGTDMAIIRNSSILDYIGTYDRIAYYETNEEGIPFVFPIKKEYYRETKQRVFLTIPNEPVAYWVPKSILNSFNKRKIGDVEYPKQGLSTADNNRFLRLWFEIDKNKMSTDCQSNEEAIRSKKKWFPFNKGGDFRRWYGNNDYVINWENGGAELKRFPNAAIRNPQYYFQPHITWSKVSSSIVAFRYRPSGSVFSDAGCAALFSDEWIWYALGLLNTHYAQRVFDIINPTINYTQSTIASLPLIVDHNKTAIDDLVLDAVSLSKEDWDSYEISWDYLHHPLTRRSSRLIADAFKKWSDECDKRFGKLKHHEQEINLLLSQTYELGNDVSSEIDEKYISIRRAERGKDIRSLISYAVGCMFGRYSLDIEGLIYAGGDWDISKYTTFIPDVDNCIPITDEPYFEDDIVGRFIEFIRSVYGAETIEENLAFIADSLGNKGKSSREIIRNYFMNDFYKDHCSTYSVTGSGKRPIYWLFDSGKQNGFKALVYMHRWNADTIGNLRVEYLHPVQRVYEKEIGRMQDIIDNSRDNREVNQAVKRREKLVKQLKETRDFDAKIAHAALSRVEIDLDDGVKANYEKVQKGPDGKSLGILAKI